VYWPSDRDITNAISADFSGTWGNRRQELVLIGEKAGERTVNGVFDKCLLTDGEMRRWERLMGNEKYTLEQREDKLNGMFEGM
jgi:hypothetical protein